MAILLKSILHNVGVVLVGVALAYFGTILDPIFGFRALTSAVVTAAGWLLLALAFSPPRVGDGLFFKTQHARDLA